VDILNAIFLQDKEEVVPATLQREKRDPNGHGLERACKAQLAKMMSPAPLWIQRKSVSAGAASTT
jgi:hypothetical protein